MRGLGFSIFLRPKFGYLLQNLPANVFYELLEGKIVENKKTKFSHAKQIFFTFFRNNDEYEYWQMLPSVFNLLEKILKFFSV